MIPSEIHEGRLSHPQIHCGTGTRFSWTRLAQSFFAVLCVVVASLAGGASAGGSLQHVGAASDGAPSADVPRDDGRNLLRPNAQTIAERAPWRAIDAAGSGPDPNSGFVLPEWEDSSRLPEDGAGPPSSDERGPAWLTVRAAYPRAPPTATGYSRTSA